MAFCISVGVNDYHYSITNSLFSAKTPGAFHTIFEVFNKGAL